MAERIVLEIPAGERRTHRLRCSKDEASTDAGSSDGGTVSATVSCSSAGSSLAGLDWSAIVMEERVVDLEVQVLLRSAEEGGSEGVEWLQPKASGGKFCGSVTVAEHPKLKNRSGDVSEVVFEFDNSYSWWTPKVVELVLVCRDTEPDPRFRPPPPLHRSATRESSPPPARRTGRVELAGCAGLRLPDLVLPVAMEAGQLALAAQDLELYRFVALVDACLAGAEALRPQTTAGDGDGGPGGGADAALLSRLAPLLEGVAELRKVCGEQLPARSV